MSLAVSVIFYAILFIALAALEPAAGFSPGRKLSAPISLHLVASDKKDGSNNPAIRAGAGKAGGKPQSGPAADAAPDPVAMPAPSISFASPASLTSTTDAVAVGDGKQIGSGAAFGESTDNPVNNEEGKSAGDSAGTGDRQGTPNVGGISAGCSPAFVSWLDSAIRTRLFYPEKARKRNLEGTVTILTEVAADGKTCEASVAQSSGSSILDRAAVSFVKSLFPAPISPLKAFSGTLRIRYILIQEGT